MACSKCGKSGGCGKGGCGKSNSSPTPAAASARAASRSSKKSMERKATPALPSRPIKPVWTDEMEFPLSFSVPVRLRPLVSGNRVTIADEDSLVDIAIIDWMRTDHRYKRFLHSVVKE